MPLDRSTLLPTSRRTTDPTAAHATEPLRLQPDGDDAGEPTVDAVSHEKKYAFAQNLLMVITFMDAVEYGVVMPSLWGYLLETLAAQLGPDPGPDAPDHTLTAPTNGTLPGDHDHVSAELTSSNQNKPPDG